MTKKSVLITGSGIGIGRATAIRFAQEGYHVFVSDILLAESEAVVSEIKADGGSATAVYLDVTDKISVEEAVNVISSETQLLQTVVCNAGIAHRQPLTSLTDEEWDLTMSVDLRGMLYVVRRSLDMLEAAENASIVCLSSIAGAVVGWEDHVPYVAAKAGVTGLVRGLAIELAPKGVRVNGVAPGLVRTAQSMSIEHSVGPEGLAAMEPSVPMGRIGKPRDISGVIAFLASRDAGYMTGQILIVDGGLTASL